MRNIKIFLMAMVLLFVFPFFSHAVTKPESSADINSLSYVFYLYYDNGQLFADRDYQVKYDLVNEKFTPESTTVTGLYRAEIINFKNEVAKTFQFDPKKGNPNFKAGKIMVKGPYVPDGLRVNFYNDQNNQLVNIFVSLVSVCNDDSFCDAVGGESETNCSNDCKKAKASPRTTVVSEPLVSEGYDLNTILIYVFSGVGVGLGAWFGWRWWKKRKEENFPLPPSSTPPVPPTPPIGFSR